ncbi:uncharacterized protein DS421_3g82000 [Arachis hypogaea]|nr:uncharacterized protein DS421_3g82000 [Arachis hypogaea]
MLPYITVFEQNVETLRDLLLCSPSTAIFSGNISSSDDLLQQRSPPTTSSPATISSCDVCSSDDLPPPTSPPVMISSGFLLVVLCVFSVKSSVSPFCSGSTDEVPELLIDDVGRFWQIITSLMGNSIRSDEEVGPLSPLFVSIAATAFHAF